MWQGCSAETRHPGYGDAEDTCPFVLWGVFDASSPTSADTANAPGSAQSILMSSTATHGPRSTYWHSSDSGCSAGDYCEEAIDFFSELLSASPSGLGLPDLLALAIQSLDLARTDRGQLTKRNR